MINIYAIQDPYHLQTEPFWNEIKDQPYFTSSYVLAGAMKKQLNKSNVSQIRALSELTKILFKNEEEPEFKVRLFAAIDRAVQALKDDDEISLEMGNAFKLSRQGIADSLMMLAHLDWKMSDFNPEKLTLDQKSLLKVFQWIKNDDPDLLHVKRDVSKEELIQNLKDVVGSDEEAFVNFEKGIVIHGIHQFTPQQIDALRILEKHFDLTFLFNYQKTADDIYDTWIRVYSAFNTYINGLSSLSFSSGVHFENESNRLESSIEDLFQGRRVNPQDYGLDILEFRNEIEFADYAGQIYRKALKAKPDNPIAAMEENFYCAVPGVNDILKNYFPKQYGNRKFLDYPIGKLFLLIASLYNPEMGKEDLTDLSRVEEILETGLVGKGGLKTASDFNVAKPLFENSRDFEEMVSRISRVQLLKRTMEKENEQTASKISYYSLDDEALENLKNTLEELRSLFYEFKKVFENNRVKFRNFYELMADYLSLKASDYADELNDEIKEAVKITLEQLKSMKKVEIQGTVDLLCSTMDLYVNDQKEQRSQTSGFIIRNFEQAEGDILLSPSRKNKIFHFAGLSDEMINSSMAELPYPISEQMIESASGRDVFANVFKSSLVERTNYTKYALNFSLKMNKANVKLSFIRNVAGKEQSLYFPLKYLGLPVTSYQKYIPAVDREEDLSKSFDQPSVKLDKTDKMEYFFCPRRMGIDSFVLENTVYRDSFSLNQYFRTLIENDIRKSRQGSHASMIKDEDLTNYIDHHKNYFPYLSFQQEVDLRRGLKTMLEKQQDRGAFPKWDSSQQQLALQRQVFSESFLNSFKNEFPIYKEGQIRNRRKVEKDLIDFSQQEFSNRSLSPKYKNCVGCPYRIVCGIGPKGKDKTNGSQS